MEKFYYMSMIVSLLALYGAVLAMAYITLKGYDVNAFFVSLFNKGHKHNKKDFIL